MGKTNDDIAEISIHAPRMGSDAQIHAVSFLLWAYFNPRSPDGERPVSDA